VGYSRLAAIGIYIVCIHQATIWTSWAHQRYPHQIFFYRNQCQVWICLEYGKGYTGLVRGLCLFV